MRNRKKRWETLLAAIAMMTVLLAGCGNSAGEQGQAAEEKTLDEQVDDIVASMSMTEKVGQMVMIGV